MAQFLRDFGFGIRLLKKSPLFATTAVLLLAIGIAGNTLIFSVVNALLLRDLPVPHPENLVRLIEVHPKDFVTWDLPYALSDEFAATDTSVSEVLAQGEANVPLSAGKSTERVRVHLISPNFFSSLGARPLLGRLLNGDDEHAAATNIVLSYDFWQRHFQGDFSVLGRSVQLAGRPFTIVGVSAEGFNGLAADTSPDLRVPAATERLLVERSAEMKPGARPLFGQIFARLRDGVPLERASGEVSALLRPAYTEAFSQIFPGQSPDLHDSRLQLEPVAKGVSLLRGQFSRGLQLMMAGAALLLLMACANVAGLLLARSVTRAREIDIRLALGASPFRLARQLFTEGLILALFGGAAGILLTIACLPILSRALPPMRDRGAVLQPLHMHIAIDLRVAGFTLLITILTAILFTLSPALRAARQGAGTLQIGRGTTSRLTPRNMMVIGQVAICTLILIGAALLFDTLHRLRIMDPGFDRNHVVTFTLDPALKAYTPAQSLALSKALLDKVSTLPGVISASLAARPLMRGTGVKATLAPMGARITAADFLSASLNNVTPGYFQTMGIRLLSGRDFTWFDRDIKPAKVIVNQTLARQFFPGRTPIGQRIGYAGPDGIATGNSEIIGVVSDAKYRSLREPIPPTAYNAAVDGLAHTFALQLRTSQRPETVIGAMRDVLHSLDPELPFIEVHTLKDEVDSSLWQEQLLATLSAIFGAIAALVAAIGLYALVDYAVKSRTREIGVRKALGAPQGRILELLSGELIVLIGSGIALGLGAYLGVASWLRSVLYDVAPWEPRAVIPAVFLVATVAVIAIAPAAWRALTVEPASALRVD